MRAAVDRAERSFTAMRAAVDGRAHHVDVTHGLQGLAQEGVDGDEHGGGLVGHGCRQGGRRRRRQLAGARQTARWRDRQAAAQGRGEGEAARAGAASGACAAGGEAGGGELGAGR
jgi:hypothetical protein